MNTSRNTEENNMEHTDFSNKAKQLIDDLKGVCASAGLGGDANEYKIVTQSFPTSCKNLSLRNL